MSCKPPYDYIPIAAPVADCAAPVYPEHRSRLLAGGSYFRSIEQGEEWNKISIEITDNIDGNADKYRLTVKYYNGAGHTISDTETYDVIQIPGAGDGISTCDTSGINLLRAAVNGVSNYIEMYERGSDTEFDESGIDVGCISTAIETFMSGGSGGPTDASVLANIHTGTQRTLIVISTTEREDGTPTNPPAERKVQQWSGSEWISYQNFIPGACPSTTTIGIALGLEYIAAKVTELNLPPVFDQDILNQSDDEGTIISISSSATDPDGDVVSYSAINLPSGITININTGLLSGTIGITTAVSSPYSVTLTANDGKGGVSTDDFVWNINPNYYSTIINDSPIAYWRLGETSGTIAVDEYGGFNGTYNGNYILGQNSLVATDVINTAVEFIGGSVRSASEVTGVSLGSLGSLSFPISFELFFNITDISTVSSLFATHRNDSGYSGFSAYVTSANIYFFMGNGASGFNSAGRNSVAASTTILQDITYHLVVVATSLTDANIYINGIELSHTLDGTSPSLDTSRGEGYIGSIQSSQTGAWFVTGKIDEFSMYDYALTPTQIHDHYIKAGFGSSSYYFTVIADSPVAFWRLDEIGGTIAVDDIGTNDGTYVSSPSLGQPGLIVSEAGYAVSFNGVDQYITVPHNAGLNSNGGSFSIELTFDAADAAQLSTLISKRQSISPYTQWHIGFGTDPHVASSSKHITILAHNQTDVSERCYITNDPILDGRGAKHLIVVFDASDNEVRLYIDGVEVPTTLVYTAGGTFPNVDSTSNLTIGALDPGTLDRHFDGKLDDVILYDFALTESQVTTHYDATGIFPNQIIVLVDGSRRWSDGTFAINANEYINPPTGYSYVGDIGDGLYAIDPDQLGSEFDVYADMTNDGGGWMRVINGPSTSLSEMAVFGNTTDISATYYSDASYGVGWGTTDASGTNWANTFPRYTIDNVDFTEMRVIFTGFYNIPAGGIGKLYFFGDGFVTYLSDSWGASGNGQTYVLNNVAQFTKLPIDVVNESAILIGHTRGSEIGMTGFTNAYAYTKRYINELWLR